MTKTFTENDLVRFLYGELNENDSYELQQQMAGDVNIQRKLEELRLLHTELDRIALSPSKRTIDKILRYSQEYQKQSV